MALRYPYNKVHSAFTTVGTQLLAADGYCQDACNNPVWESARIDLYSGLTQIINAIGNVRGGYCGSPYDWNILLAFEWTYLNAGGDGVEVTMDAILSAMVAAESEQIMYFVGLVDAYRQSVWNKPFNQEFFAALARGFGL